MTAKTLRTHDNTMLSDFNYCERKYAARHVLDLVPEAISFALSFGKLMHRGWDCFYSSLAKGEDLLIAAEKTLLLMESLPYEDPIEDFRTKGRAMMTMASYINHYGEDPEIEILFTETPFDLETDDGFRYGGVIDLIVKHIPSNLLWVMDHKTTSRLDKWYFDNYTRDPQMIGYTFSGSILHGKELAGAIINVTALYTDNDSNRKNDKVNVFLRDPIDSFKRYPDWLIAEWKRTVSRRLVQIEKKVVLHEQEIESGRDPLEVLFDESIWTPTHHNCVGKYGKCPYYDLCNTSPGRRELTMLDDYKEHRWDWADIDE